MYDLILVRRRRRRKVAAIVSFVCSIGITALIIISFLGQYTGTFTISLVSSSVKLSLSDEESFVNPTSYLRIDKLNLFEEYTYDYIKEIDLDKENKEVPFDTGEHEVVIRDKDGNKKSSRKYLSYFKYTFYLGNLGSKVASYDMKINLVECTQSTDGTGRTLDDTLRVMVYENDVNDADNLGEHNVAVYAKEVGNSDGTNIDLENHPTKREFISAKPYRTDEGYVEDEAHPLAISFEDEKTIKTYNRTDFYAGQIRRYTIVSWLEGQDRDSTGKKGAPVNATLKLGVEITAYENE